mmetsp:Transcript_2008/g.4585  ORF Transcript_2008/g.4585 Transcript_2008/m.4585 type:complete len:206 (+) Transcript_2008:188-805(+)
MKGMLAVPNLASTCLLAVSLASEHVSCFSSSLAPRPRSTKNLPGASTAATTQAPWLASRASLRSPRRQLSMSTTSGGFPRGCLPWDTSIVPPQIYAVGMNFASHASELGKPAPSKPIIFAKGLNTIIGTGQDIVLPAEELQVDYEGELACIIGSRPCKDVSVKDALSYVQGYCIANDVSGRSWQFQHFNGGQVCLDRDVGAASER